MPESLFDILQGSKRISMRLRLFIGIVPLLLISKICLAQAAPGTEPFRDPKLSIDQRVDDLLSHLTLDEKIAMLGQMQPAILRQVCFVEGYEARVYNRKFNGMRVGVAIRTPNVDLARDPRWGRSEESFGEDPYFVGKMSVALIQGLQGDNPKYLRAASTMKHFLANSNEDGRTSSSSDFDERNLREYYLVPFQMGIEEGNAQSFMASYNAVNKIPDTVSPFIRDIVEKEWKFDGMVCTDAGSLPNLTREFHYYPDPTAAVAGCVKAGISVFLDRYEQPLRDALDKKLVTEADIERNIKGNLRMRMRLGEFDPPGMSPWEKISGDEERSEGN